MGLLPRIAQKIFGGTGGTGEFGAFGSDSLGTPTTTKNLTTIQSLAPYLQGWFAATDNANEPPRIQDLNGLCLLITSQLAYYFQNGIPEWNAATEYFDAISFCQVAGTVYRSKYGIDGTPNLNHNPATDDGTYWEPGDTFLRQLKWDLDTLGFTGYDLAADEYLSSKLTIARSKTVGEWVLTERKLTPTAFSAARSTAHPEYSEYCPVIPRFDADHDITTTEVPQSVIDAFNAELVSIDGVTSFSATLATGVLTFADNPTNNKLLNLILAAGMVNRWHASNESAAYEGSGALYTGARQYCFTIGGVNYPISNLSYAGKTVTLSTYPANGSVTVEIGPSRIAASSTSARLRKISGFVPVIGGDYSGEVGIMMDAMDRLQGHRLELASSLGVFNDGVYGTGASKAGRNITTSANVTAATIIAKDIITDVTNGTPRTGKTTNPRTHGVGGYTFLQTLLATSWTSA